MAVPAAAAPAPPPPAGGGFDFGAAVESGGGGRAERDDRPRRPRPRDDDDDAPRSRPRDEEADDRPRRRPEQKKSMAPVLLLVGGFLVLACCGGGGFGVYYSVGKVREAAERARAENDAKQKQIDDETKRRAGDATGNRPADEANPKVGGGDGRGAKALPPLWVRYEAPDKSFRAAFPHAPIRDNVLAAGPPEAVGEPYYYEATNLGTDSIAICHLVVVKFPPTSKAADRQRELEKMPGLDGLLNLTKTPTRRVDWLGKSAKEMDVSFVAGKDATVLMRWVVVGDTGFIGKVTHKNMPDVVATFFDNIEPLSK